MTAINKAGNNTAEPAVKGVSAVADKVYKGKMGSGGQTIYINKYSQYYYANKKGVKVDVAKTRLKNKMEKLRWK